MSRFYISPDSVKDNKIFVSGEEFHHIVDVMRLKAGDDIDAFDGKGNLYRGVIEKFSNKNLVISVSTCRKIDSKSKISVALMQSIPKKSKMDDIVEKCTELGIDEIIPVITERTIVDLNGEKAVSRINRWRKIAREATKQCGRTEITEILSVAKLKDLSSKIREFDLVLIPCLSGERKKIKEILKNFNGKRILFLIGPEGDFTKDEIELVKASGGIPTDLGNNVLRVDTAAISTLSIIKYEIEGD